MPYAHNYTHHTHIRRPALPGPDSGTEVKAKEEAPVDPDA
jgi:hypothetical protein